MAIINVPAGTGTLANAINNGSAGDEFHLESGIYLEGDIPVDYNYFKILGPNANINPNTGVRVPEAIVQDVNLNLTLAKAGIEINGIKFTGTPSYYVINGSGAGDELDDSIISNNIFELALNPNKAVVHITGTTNIDDNLIIENNLFNDHLTKGTGSSSDIHISTADNITIRNNVSIDCDYAFLQFDSVVNSRILNNHIANADRKGIQLANSEGPCKNILVDGNTIINCNTEHASDHGGIRLYGNSGIENIVITNNTIKDTWNSFAFHDDPFGDASYFTFKYNTIMNSQNADILNNAEHGVIYFDCNNWDNIIPTILNGGDWIDAVIDFKRCGSYRANPTDTEQQNLENAQYEGNVIVYTGAGNIRGLAVGNVADTIGATSGNDPVKNTGVVKNWRDSGLDSNQGKA